MASAKRSVAIIGTGVGAASTAVNLRRYGWTGDIGVISTMSNLPLEMMESVTQPGLEIEKRLRAPVLTPSLAERYELDLIWTDSVSSLEREDGQVVLADGWELPFSYLVLSPGLLQKEVAVHGASLPGVLHANTPYDLAEVRRHFEMRKRVAIWGNSVSSFILAAAAATFGCVVTLVLDRKLDVDTTMPDLLVDVLAAYVEGLGINVARERQVVSVDGSRHVTGLKTDEGDSFAADIVVVDPGRLPDTSLARTSGLETAAGMLTDAMLRSVTDSRIFACGSICSYSSSVFGEHVNFWGERVEAGQGETIARNILEPLRFFDDVPIRIFPIGPSVLGLIGSIFERNLVRLRSGSGSAYLVSVSENDEITGLAVLGKGRSVEVAATIFKRAIARKIKVPRVRNEPGCKLSKVLEDIAAVVGGADA